MKTKDNRMDEWLKVHTYVVCNNTLTALDKMIEEYQHLCERLEKSTAKMNRWTLVREVLLRRY